ncbi:PREDICTED: ribosomal protein L11 methyltransferase isoform X1 [Theobroma cacao]|uniref:ETFB lysine methyltransferase n=1 Tax=Theobroma cacao TaxID=3641 RepID=A0AB32UY95_THECC|nr:PREDICTED: ribosomal protein L11 methyltransferase isoform X1 [Theobroma cacao]
MPLRHIFKHLTLTSSYGFSTLSRRFIHPPLTLLFTNINPKIQPLIPAETSLPFSHGYTSVTEPQSSTLLSPYITVRIQCQKEIADMFSEALMCFGASSTTVGEDNNCDTSKEICMESIFPESEDVDVCISQAADSLGLKEIPSYEVTTGEHYDWIKKTQESFDSVEVTEGLWIVPEWKTTPDVQAMNIILNPGLAFGTGEHPTTRLCLLLLQRLIKGGERFLDYGTGSGILSIAALKFGASLSVGIDIDPLAITSARQNAALNNIGPEKLQLRLVSGNTSSPSIDDQKYDENQSLCEPVVESEPEKYDVIIANILLNPLLELADDIVSPAEPGAAIGLSGILSDQLPDIIDRYSPLLDNISVSEMDDWACLSGTKKIILTGS